MEVGHETVLPPIERTASSQAQVAIRFSGLLLILLAGNAAYASCNPQLNGRTINWMAKSPSANTHVWGNNDTGYSTESDIEAALVHSGLLPVGGYASVNITTVAVPVGSSVTGTTANGITSSSKALSNSDSTSCVMKLSLNGAPQAAPAPSFVDGPRQSPMPWVAGSGPQLLWQLNWATSLDMSCSSDATGYDYKGGTLVNMGETDSGTLWIKGFGVMADAAWVGHPSTCTLTAKGPGGSVSKTLPLVTIASGEDPAVCAAQTPKSGVYTARPSSYAPTGNNLSGYRVDTPVQTALVHAGLLKPFESAKINFTPLYTEKSFIGTSANGITSLSQSAPYCGMMLSVDGPVTPAPALSFTVSPTTFPASINQTSGPIKVSYKSTAANSVAVDCASDRWGQPGGSDAYHNQLTMTPQGPDLPPDGAFDITASAGDIGHQIACKFIATGADGSTKVVTQKVAVTNGKPWFQILRTSAGLADQAGDTLKSVTGQTTVVAGKPYHTSWQTIDTTAVTVACSAADNSQDIYRETVNPRQLMGDSDVTAKTSWIGHPSTCTWTATGPGGLATSYTETITTVSAASQVKPVVQIPASSTAGSTIAMSATLSTPESTVAAIRFSNNNNVIGWGVRDSGAAIWRYSWSAVPTGTYNVWALAFDAAGNVVGTAAPSVQLSVTGPAGQALSAAVQAPATANPGDTIALGATLTDASSKVATVKFFNGSNLIGAGVGINEGASYSWHYSFNWPAVPQGNYTIQAQAFDANGSAVTALSAPVSITVGSVAPLTLAVQAPSSAKAGDTLALSATPSTANASMSSVKFFNGSTVIGGGVKDASANVWRFNWPSVPAGSYAITAQAFDAQNNALSAVSASAAIKVVDSGGTNQGAGISLSPASSSAVQGQAVSLTVKVTGTNPSGTVTFKEGDKVLASGVALSQGSAQFSSATLSIGVHSIVAVYSGDAANPASTSAAAQITITSNTASDATPIPVAIAAPHLANADAGSLPGELNVGNNGAANYSVGIEVPPGTAGLQPAVSFSYSSQGGNGVLGLGWSLGGFSRITHCGKTIAQDGMNERINFSNSDRLCLDGQRLVLVNGNTQGDSAYWSATAEYRTEIESFARITTQMVGGASGTRAFKVEYKDGRIATFGYDGNIVDSSFVYPVLGEAPHSGTSAPAPTAKSSAQAWAISRIFDRAGNYIAFNYSQDSNTGEHLPRSIAYGGHGQATHAGVAFEYEGRQDAWTRYIDETRNDLRSRITHIKTYVGDNLDAALTAGALVRDYSFSYKQSPSSGRSLLQSVQACARNPLGNVMECLPQTSFNWGEPRTDKVAGFESKGGWAGAPEMETHTSHGTTQHPGTSLPHPEFFAMTDFENHGRVDLLEKRIAVPVYIHDNPILNLDNPNKPGTLATQYRYFHNNGAGFTVYTYRISTQQAFAVLQTVDVNGDGAPDLLVTTDQGPKVCISPLAKGGPINDPIVFDCNNNYSAVGENKKEYGVVPVDINGDGRSAFYGVPTQGSVPTATYPTLCIGTSPCVIDKNPPWAALGDYSPLDARRYNSFTQMVDFAGTGKPYSVVWSEAHFFGPYTDQSGRNDQAYWDNLQPFVSIYGFTAPGVAPVGQMAGYSYVPLKDGEVNCLDVECLPPYRFDEHLSGANLVADFNGSGYSNLLFGYLTFDQKSKPPIINTASTTLCLSTGRALDCRERLKFSGANYRHILAVGNFVGGGQPTYLVVGRDPNNVLYGSDDVQMCRFIGDDTTATKGTDDNAVCEPWTGLPAGLLSEISGQPITGRIFLLDLEGTGRPQLVSYHYGHFINPNMQTGEATWVPDGRWEVFSPVDMAKPHEALDRLVSVTNGVGATSRVEYDDGLASGVVAENTGNSSLSYPMHVIRTPGKIASRLVHSNGVAPDRSTRFSYSDAAIDMWGRGGLGFSRVAIEDEQTHIKTNSYFRQDWPFIGMLVASSGTNDQGVDIVNTSNTLAVQDIAQQVGSTKFVYVAGNTVKRQDFDGVSPISRTDTVNEYTDGWGNLNKSTVTVADYQPLSGSKQFLTVTETGFLNQKDSWVIGRSQQVKTTKSDTDNASKPVLRTQQYTVNPSNGWITAEVQEPNDPRFRVETKYCRNTAADCSGTDNAFGLVNRKILNWLDPVANAQKSASSLTEYDNRGRFAVRTTNALGQVSNANYDAATGAHIDQEDPNHIHVSWVVDGFGRASVEKHQDGNEVRSYTKRCQGDAGCLAGSASVKIVDHFHGNDRITAPAMSYTDSAGHDLGSRTFGFDKRAVLVEKFYDVLGRLQTTSLPHFENSATIVGSRVEYDGFDRIRKQWAPDENGTQQFATTDYHGLIIVLTNAKGQVRTEQKNPAGQLIQVTDPMGGVTRFAYDAAGNLAQTIDPANNVITVETDLLGRKSDLLDPDAGWIHYEYDPLGRMLEQVSPNQRAADGKTVDPTKRITMEYDLLSRITARHEPDLESRWDYDTAQWGIGQLAEAYTLSGNSKDYSRTQAYDGYGRPTVTTQVLRDGIYTSVTEYDVWSRPINQKYQRGSDVANMKVFATRYNDAGYIQRYERGGLVLGRIDSMNASGQPTGLTLGNGLTEVRTPNPYTGRLSDAHLSKAGGQAMLQEGYGYDVLGNVLTRTEAWDVEAFSETFDYDALNRLKSSVVANVTEKFCYDSVGNLLSKTGVGVPATSVADASTISCDSAAGRAAYTYPSQGASVAEGATAPHPHAVQSIQGIDGTFVYDKNGNMLQGLGRTADWTSFDMPTKISNAKGISSSFIYGSEHQRVLQTRSDQSKEIYAGGQVVESGIANGQQSYLVVKTYWPAGLGLEIDDSRTGTTLSWTYVDRLGSPIAVFDEAGNLREKLAYDAWGKRRTLTGALSGGSNTPDNIDGKVDNRGFTNHEMLDQLDLVHMNGRVYEPLVGRFLSADPMLQDPMNGQSYNRYSYVMNNPTNLTDPTGFTSQSVSDGCKRQPNCVVTYQAPDKYDSTYKNLTKSEAVVCGIYGGCENINKLMETDPKKAKQFLGALMNYALTGDSKGNPDNSTDVAAVNAKGPVSPRRQVVGISVPVTEVEGVCLAGVCANNKTDESGNVHVTLEIPLASRSGKNSKPLKDVYSFGQTGAQTKQEFKLLELGENKGGAALSGTINLPGANIFPALNVSLGVGYYIDEIRPYFNVKFVINEKFTLKSAGEHWRSALIPSSMLLSADLKFVYDNYIPAPATYQKDLNEYMSHSH